MAKIKVTLVKSTIGQVESVKGTIKALGIDQWQNGYPSRDVIEKDIELS